MTVNRVNDRAVALTGVAAAVVWLGGALANSWAERDFMDELGWDVWPSGLALGPHGWAQILVFLAVAALYITFAAHIWRVVRWSRLAVWGGRLMLAGACVTPLLAFTTDPMTAATTWHGALHAAGYVALVLSMLIGFATVLPGLVRRSPARAWRTAPLALLLVAPAWLAPNGTATSSYLFFAVPFALLAALALVLATGDAPSADRAVAAPHAVMTEPA